MNPPWIDRPLPGPERPSGAPAGAQPTRRVGAGDADEIVKDYTDESVLITADGVTRGRAALRTAFDGLFAGLFAPGTYDFVMDASHIEGEVAHIVWHADCASAEVVLGTDTFVVRDGEITAQTFAAKIVPK